MWLQHMCCTFSQCCVPNFEIRDWRVRALSEYKIFQPWYIGISVRDLVHTCLWHSPQTSTYVSICVWTAIPQVTFWALATSDLACSLSQPSSLAQYGPFPHFIILAYLFSSPSLIPFPHVFHALHPQSPIPAPFYFTSRSPCSIFISILFFLILCLFPMTLICFLQYLYVQNFLYIPQSEINIDCPCQGSSIIFPCSISCLLICLCNKHQRRV